MDTASLLLLTALVHDDGDRLLAGALAALLLLGGACACVRIVRRVRFSCKSIGESGAARRQRGRAS